MRTLLFYDNNPSVSYSHAQIQEFSSGGVQVSLTKKALITFFLFCFFQFSVYLTEVKWSISKKSIIFQGSRGGPTFPGGGGVPIAYSL